MPCYRCGRVQTDPAKGASPWARGVTGSLQVLICPECQLSTPTWESELDSCPRCGSTRLSVVLGTVVCRSCNYQRDLSTN
jgi:predicted amidophosphoribosyltransferase